MTGSGECVEVSNQQLLLPPANPPRLTSPRPEWCRGGQGGRVVLCRSNEGRMAVRRERRKEGRERRKYSLELLGKERGGVILC